MKKRLLQYLKKMKPGGIQSTLMLVFSFISVLTMLLMGVLMYMRFSMLSRQETTESSRKLMGTDRRIHGGLSGEHETNLGCGLL